MNLTRPLCIFDIESTGTDPVNDRILTLAIVKVHPDGKEEEFYGEFNGGGIIMDQETIDVHGITNENAATFPPFTEDAGEDIISVMAGCDLAGFNITGFDCTMLYEELARVGIEWNTDGVNFVDAGTLFKIKEPRTLSAAVQFYCKREHEGAHNAMADVKATLAVLRAQMNRYDDLLDISIPELAKASQFEPRVDLAGKIVLNKAGVPVYSFGNAKGVPVVDDPGFGSWLLGKDFPRETKKKLRALLWPEDNREDKDDDDAF
jgi:DNA polymerase III subunit epsilon